MKKKLLCISAFIAVLMAQLFTAGATALAQAYGEGVYGNSVYNDTREDTSGGGQPSTSGDAPRSSQNSPVLPQSTSPITDDDIEQPDPTDNDRGTIGNNSTDDVGVVNPISAEADDSSDDNDVVKWFSVGAIVAALLLIIFALIARKRRQA